MNLDEKIAEITLEPETKHVVKLDFHGRRLKFRCRRCAIFCCKLGGPRLTRTDIERLKQAGNSPRTFLNSREACLKSASDGSCVFLSFNTEAGLYQCSVYEQRPAFCRLYPFQFEELGRHFYALKFISCCNGLNAENGEVVDHKFFIRFLRETLLELIKADAI